MFRPVRVAAPLLLLAVVLVAPTIAAARQEAQTYAPGSGAAQVIAQGVVALPAGDVVWRTVRTRAGTLEAAAFEPRPLGFVLATAGPLLLTDDESGAQTRLGTGEAALVRDGTVQRRASLTDDPVSYLSIELVPTDAPSPPDDAIVLQPGQPFASPGGSRDLDLLRAVLTESESIVVPDTGAKNVILVTEGAAGVGRPGGDRVVLLAGEAASFSGELEVAAAPDGGAPQATVVVAMIGPVVPAPPAPAAPVAEEEQQPAASPPAGAAGLGSIAVQVFSCPPGMDAATLAAAVCAPIESGFEIGVSGASLAAPLTVAQATTGDGSLVWSELPFGAYQLSVPVLPAGATNYVVSARDLSGDPGTGYQIVLDETNPEVMARVYVFTAG
jgi:hypothetical protein